MSYDPMSCRYDFYVPTKPLSREAQKSWDMMVMECSDEREYNIKMWICQFDFYFGFKRFMAKVRESERYRRKERREADLKDE